ncbi:MAG: hypothetical protein ACOZAA_01420 [Pseudomonadota bacterium]
MQSLFRPVLLGAATLGFILSLVIFAVATYNLSSEKDLLGLGGTSAPFLRVSLAMAVLCALVALASGMKADAGLSFFVGIVATFVSAAIVAPPAYFVAAWKEANICFVNCLVRPARFDWPGTDEIARAAEDADATVIAIGGKLERPFRIERKLGSYGIKIRIEEAGAFQISATIPGARDDEIDLALGIYGALIEEAGETKFDELALIDDSASSGRMPHGAGYLHRGEFFLVIAQSPEAERANDDMFEVEYALTVESLPMRELTAAKPGEPVVKLNDDYDDPRGEPVSAFKWYSLNLADTPRTACIELRVEAKGEFDSSALLFAPDRFNAIASNDDAQIGVDGDNGYGSSISFRPEDILRADDPPRLIAAINGYTSTGVFQIYARDLGAADNETCAAALQRLVNSQLPSAMVMLGNAPERAGILSAAGDDPDWRLVRTITKTILVATPPGKGRHASPTGEMRLGDRPIRAQSEFVFNQQPEN